MANTGTFYTQNTHTLIQLYQVRHGYQAFWTVKLPQTNQYSQHPYVASAIPDPKRLSSILNIWPITAYYASVPIWCFNHPSRTNVIKPLVQIPNKHMHSREMISPIDETAYTINLSVFLRWTIKNQTQLVRLPVPDKDPVPVPHFKCDTFLPQCSFKQSSLPPKSPLNCFTGTGSPSGTRKPTCWKKKQNPSVVRVPTCLSIGIHQITYTRSSLSAYRRPINVPVPVTHSKCNTCLVIHQSIQLATKIAL
jgi:hypothetical protein